MKKQIIYFDTLMISEIRKNVNIKLKIFYHMSFCEEHEQDMLI